MNHSDACRTAVCRLARIGMLAIGLAAFAFAAGPALAGDAWTQFRGPNQNGDAGDADIPVEFGEDHNVTWKTAISGRGWSTPIVEGGQVWLTTATEDGTESFVYCLDRESGEVLFRERLFYNEDPEPLGPASEANSYASPTGTIDDNHFYAHFGTYGTAAIDRETFETVWQRTDINARHYRGPGSSIILVDDKLILTMDGVDVQYLTALDRETGDTVWQTDRTTEWDDYDEQGNVIAEGDLRKGYSTPIVYEVDGRRQLASPGAMAAFAYAPDSGEELWTITYNGFNAASSPVLAAGRVLINTSTPRQDLLAVNPDGEGDITDTHIDWRFGRGVPTKPSPVVVNDQLVFFINDGGIGTALDAETGESFWQARIGGSYSASPIHANGRIYFASEEGTVTVITATRDPEVIAENEFDGGFMASPAVAGDTLFLRSKTHIYRIDSE